LIALRLKIAVLTRNFGPQKKKRKKKGSTEIHIRAGSPSAL